MTTLRWHLYPDHSPLSPNSFPVHLHFHVTTLLADLFLLLTGVTSVETRLTSVTLG